MHNKNYDYDLEIGIIFYFIGLLILWVGGFYDSPPSSSVGIVLGGLGFKGMGLWYIIAYLLFEGKKCQQQNQEKK